MANLAHMWLWVLFVVVGGPSAVGYALVLGAEAARSGRLALVGMCAGLVGGGLIRLVTPRAPGAIAMSLAAAVAFAVVAGWLASGVV